MFLFGGAVGGTQQEIARATHPSNGQETSIRALGAFSWVAIGTVTGLGVLVSVALAGTSFVSDPLILSVAFVIGLVGYVLTSILTGIFYGVGALQWVSALITVDALLRGTAVVIGLLLGIPVWVLAFAIALPFGVSVLLVWLVSRRGIRGQIHVQASTKTLLVNALKTVGASTAVGVMVAGLPLVLDIFLQDASAVLIASLVLTVTVTRAPLIIPLTALQSYLVVQFRGLRDGLLRRVLLLLAAVAGLGAVAAVAGAVVGPSIVQLIGQGRYAVDGLVVGAVVASAALIGMMCVTSAGLIATHRHNVYFAGWAVAAGLTVAMLAWLPVSPLPRAILALCVPALVGLVVQFLALLRSPGTAPYLPAKKE